MPGKFFFTSFSEPPRGTPFASYAAAAGNASSRKRAGGTIFIAAMLRRLLCAFVVLHLVARRSGTQAQVLLLGAIALREPEGLVAPGKLLRGPVLPRMLVPGRGLEGEVGIG